MYTKKWTPSISLGYIFLALSTTIALHKFYNGWKKEQAEKIDIHEIFITSLKLIFSLSAVFFLFLDR